MIVPHNRKNIIIPREPRTVPYIENVPSPEIDYIETGLGTYSVFMDEEQEPCVQPIIEDDKCWHIHFDGASSLEGNGAKIILFSPTRKPIYYSFWLNFECTNNITEFEPLAPSLQKALDLGFQHLQTFDDSESVINMIKGIYRPAKKVFQHYIDIID